MELYIKSFEGNIYLAEQRHADIASIVCDKNNQPIRFDSLSQAKEYFSNTQFEHVWLEHHSAYDEMCGLSGSDNAMILPLAW